MEQARRDFLKFTGATLTTTLATSALVASGSPPVFAEDAAPKQSLLGAFTSHELPKLPYAYDALEPHLDAKTMELHHSVHHLAYVKGLNKAEEELAKARASGDYSLVEYWSKKAAFHGGGHELHTLFWESMAPAGTGGAPSAVLKQMLDRDFGSFDAFKAHFSAAAGSVEASGWAVLHYRARDKRLVVLQIENQHKLSPSGTAPLLACDVWEHAYYLKYQNKRADYVKAWWNVVDWNQVNKRFAELMA